MLFSEQIYNEIIKHPYYAYTTAYDEVVTPSEMLQPTEAMDLHSTLLKFLGREAALAEEFRNFDTIHNYRRSKTKSGSCYHVFDR